MFPSQTLNPSNYIEAVLAWKSHRNNFLITYCYFDVSKGALATAHGEIK